MRIIALGTSHGNPTNCRFNSSTLIQIGADLYLVDAGAPANALMIRRELPFQALKAVFITHMHEDHVGGLPGMIKSLAKYPVADQHTVIYLPETQAIEGLFGWMQSMHYGWDLRHLSFETIHPGPLYRNDRLTVSAICTAHYENQGQDFPSFAYRFEHGAKRVFHTGDLRWDFGDFPREALDMESDACICECTHFRLDAARDVLARCRTRLMIFSHVGQEWHGDGEARFREIVGTLPFPCALAHDGDTYDL